MSLLQFSISPELALPIFDWQAPARASNSLSDAYPENRDNSPDTPQQQSRARRAKRSRCATPEARRAASEREQVFNEVEAELLSW
jgi:hypothetical protein